jgi:LDH2 family malate/lactate/ureidoglycolate dehydrogenase
MGRLAPYAEAAAAAGCALFMCANDGGANQYVVPAPGAAPRLSTNPIAFGVPRAAAPHLVVDMATSVHAHGTLAALREAGSPAPEHAVPPGSPELLLPMAGYKGFALGLAVEALAGALTGAGVVSAGPPPESQGALLFAIDVSAISSPADVTRDLEAAIAWVRSGVSPGDSPIHIPGEAALAGPGAEIAIAAPVWRALIELSERLELQPPAPVRRGRPGAGRAPSGFHPGPGGIASGRRR